MNSDFLHTEFGASGSPVFRLGLSGTYRPGKQTIFKAIDEGVNFFFCYGFDTHMTRALREAFPGNREKYMVVTGAYNFFVGHPSIRRTLEKRLRQMRTDYIDVFLFLSVLKDKHFPERTREEFYRLREEGKVRAIGMSCHDRKFVGQLAAEGKLNAFMMRYNAAHRGAEQDIFPHIKEHNPGIISYTATCWRQLLKRPHGWPPDGRIPTAGECYRFVLTNPHVHVCLSAPSNIKHLEENIAAVRQGPLDEDDMQFMRTFGDLVHHKKKWFT